MLSPQLETFITVAECQSFTKAAEKRFVTPASIMKHINTLEGRLNVKLLERTHKGITLTPAGNLVYEEAKKLQQSVDTIIEKLNTFPAMQHFTIRVGTSLLNPCQPLFDLWAQQAAAHDSYSLQIVPFADNAKQLEQLLHHLGDSIDLLIGPCGSHKWLEFANFLPLGQYALCCSMPYSHPLATKAIITLEDLHQQTMMISTTTENIFVKQAREAILREVSDLSLIPIRKYYDSEIFNQCIEGNHILLTLEGWNKVHPALTTIPLDLPIRIPWGILYSKKPSAELKNFIKLIADSLPTETKNISFF